MLASDWLLIGWPKNYGSHHDVLGVTDSEDYAKDWNSSTNKLPTLSEKIPPTNAKALQRALGFFHFSKSSGIIDMLFDLENLLLAYFDGVTGFYKVEEKQVFLGEKVFAIIFANRDRFNDFLSFVNGNWKSCDEDDHNIFDLRPFLIDIGYSDMIFMLDGETKNPSY